MKIKLLQKYYIQCLFIDNKVSNYTESVIEFKKKFENISFLLTEYNIKKIKENLKSNYKNYTLEQLCKSIKIDNMQLIIDIFPIRVDI